MLDQVLTISSFNSTRLVGRLLLMRLLMMLQTSSIMLRSGLLAALMWRPHSLQALRTMLLQQHILCSRRHQHSSTSTAHLSKVYSPFNSEMFAGRVTSLANRNTTPLTLPTCQTHHIKYQHQVTATASVNPTFADHLRFNTPRINIHTHEHVLLAVLAALADQKTFNSKHWLHSSHLLPSRMFVDAHTVHLITSLIINSLLSLARCHVRY